MTDPITAALLMIAGITGGLLLFAALAGVIERAMTLFPPCQRTRSALMSDHIRRMK